MFTRSQISRLSPYRYFNASFGPLPSVGASATNKILLNYRLPFKARLVRAEMAAEAVTGTVQVRLHDATHNIGLAASTEVVQSGFTVPATGTGWLDAGTLIQIRADSNAAEDCTGLTATLILESWHGLNGLTNDLD